MEERCVGCMLGVMIGDVLGAPVEGWPRAKILAEFGKVTQFEKGTHMGVPELGPRCGMYTDDTQSTMGLMYSLGSTSQKEGTRIQLKLC